MTSHYVLSTKVTIVAGVNDGFKFYDGSGTHLVTLDPGDYYLYADSNVVDSTSLLYHIKTKMEAASAITYTWTVGINTSKANKSSTVTMTTSSGSTTLLITDSQFTFDVTIIGLPTGSNLSGSTIAATNSSWVLYTPDQPVSSWNPEQYTRDVKQWITKSGRVLTFVASDNIEKSVIGWVWVNGDRVLERHNSSDPNRTFAVWWKNANDGVAIRLYAQTPDSSGNLSLVAADLVGTYIMDQESAKSIPVPQPRPEPGITKYHIGALVLRKDTTA